MGWALYTLTHWLVASITGLEHQPSPHMVSTECFLLAHIDNLFIHIGLFNVPCCLVILLCVAVCTTTSDKHSKGNVYLCPSLSPSLSLSLSPLPPSFLPPLLSPSPVDDTRVKLDDEDNDYINANFVTVSAHTCTCTCNH